MKFNADVKLLTKGILVGLGIQFLTGVLLVALSILGGSLMENDLDYNLVLNVTLGITILGMFSIVAVGVWVGLKASKKGWLLAGITVFVAWSVPSVISGVNNGLVEAAPGFALGACLAGLGMLCSYVGDLVRRQRHWDSVR